MQDLNVNFFFNLAHFSHAKIFENVSFPWEALLHLKAYLDSQSLGRMEGDISSSAYLVNSSKISIGKGSRIEPGAYIEGPCILGANTVVRHGAYIRGYVIAGDNCVIGHDTEVKHSILLNQVHAAHFNYIGDSLLGNEVNLGAGSKCANFRFDHGLISIHHEGKKIATALKKLGAIIGDKAQLGCNCVTNPGTLIGKGAFCSPCLNITGYIPPNTLVSPSQPYHIKEH